jgi:quinol monooxygenase YgiN
MEEQITIVVPIKAKKETRDEVRGRLLSLAEKTRCEEGNINYILHDVPNQPELFIIYENWKNQTALDFHMKQEYLTKFLEDSKTLLAEEVRGSICRVIPE